MSNIIVLGSGMVGSAMAIDLAKQHQVTVTDIDQDALGRAQEKCPELRTRQLDITDVDELQSMLANHDLAINALPGHMGFKTLITIIEAGRPVIDITFFPENALELDPLAKKNNVTAIVDCGIAPGMSNLILGHYNEILKITDFECLVGGLPKIKKWPFYYKAPFSPGDVIEEYTRPVRYVEKGEIVVKEPLSDCEYINLGHVGKLESFNSDGLRSLLFTMPHIPNMKEKTLRYPGHIEYIKVLKETGFFNTDEINVDGCLIAPLDFTSRILFNEWKLGEEEEEMTLMQVTMKGINVKGQSEEVVYTLYDEYNTATRTSSMARTTGYTATAAANLLLEGLFREKGIFPPELIGQHKVCFDFILKYLEDRKIHFVKSSRLI